MSNIGIIGGGVSGVISAIYASKNGNKVTILEKNNDILKKLLITGSGRCNYFNSDQNIKHYHSKNEEYLNIYTNYKTIKRVKVNELVSISRAKKGNMLFKKAKTKDYKINFAYLTVTKDTNIYRTDNEIHELKTSEIPIMDLSSTLTSSCGTN